MAQYFEVLSQSDGSVEPGGQFFNGNQDNEPTQVRYILADDSRQFPTQQLILSADPVMVVDGSQQQIQGVVIDQGQITYQQTAQPQQYSAVVQNANVSSQQAQQIYYMETNSGQGGDNLPTVQTVIEQTAIQQTSQAATPTQPIVLNHHMGSSSSNLGGNRPMVQGNPQRPVLHIKTPIRQGHIQLNPQNRLISSQMRPGLPQQVRPHQSAPLQMRSMSPQQIQMRPRVPTQQVRQPGQQMQPRPLSSQQRSQQMVSLINRQLSALKHQQQQSPQAVPQPQQVIQQSQQVVQQQQQTQQVIQQPQPGGQIMPGQVQKGINEFQRQQQQQLKNTEHDELDDHDPSMNSSPSMMANYKKFLEQRQHVVKHPILAKLSNNIKVTQTPPGQQQNPQSQQCTINQTIDDVVNQVTQQQAQPQLQMQQQSLSQPQQQGSMTNVQQPGPNAVQAPQMPQKKQRAPVRSKNPNPSPRNPGPIRQRPPRLPLHPQSFNAARIIGPQQPPPGPRFAANQQAQPRFPNQQQMMHQRMAQHQQGPQRPQTPPQQPQPQPVQQPPQPVQQQSPQPQQQIQQNGGNQSQMNYLITPPTPNRPRQQRPLPAYIPSSQIQQIIESTPIAEEFSDSIRMLVLLENGEQRLITFTLPKEACTIQEILEQVNVPFTAETNIQVTEANTNGINYIVTVGNVSNIAYAANEEEPQEVPSPESQPPPPPQQQMAPNPPNRQMQQQPNNRPPYAPKGMPQEQMPPVGHAPPPPEPPKPPSPEPPKELPPKLVPGKLAVCLACGYTGEDFNRCTRCLRKLPDNVKSVDSPVKIDVNKTLPPEIAKHMSNHSAAMNTSLPAKTNSTKPEAGSKPSPTKKKKSKAVENESVVISSDEEEDEKKPVKSVRVSEQLLKNLGASISISPVTKEPSLTEIKKHVRKLSIEPAEMVKIDLICRTVRIGSYRFIPPYDVIVDSKCVLIRAPVIENKSEIKTIRIDRGDIVKVLVCFSKALPVIFYYLNVGAAPIIRDMLNMKKENGLYYDPIEEKEDSYRKITLLPEDFSEDYKEVFGQLYSTGTNNILEELTSKEANDILIKTCPKDTSTSNIGLFPTKKNI